MSDTIRLDPADNVATAIRPLEVGQEGAIELIPRGHKIALEAIPKGAPVRKYAQLIGYAGQDIAQGAHVHTHNLEFRNVEQTYEFSTNLRPAPAPAQQDTFQGYRRDNGKVGTRNFIRRPDLSELLGHRCPDDRQPFHARGAGPLPQYRRRRRLRPRHRLRHGRPGLGRVRGAAAGHVGLCPPPQCGWLPDGGPRLRDEPDRLADGGLRADPRAALSGDEHPGRGGPQAHHRDRHRQDHRHAAAGQ